MKKVEELLRIIDEGTGWVKGLPDDFSREGAVDPYYFAVPVGKKDPGKPSWKRSTEGDAVVAIVDRDKNSGTWYYSVLFTGQSQNSRMKYRKGFKTKEDAQKAAEVVHRMELKRFKEW